MAFPNFMEFDSHTLELQDAKFSEKENDQEWGENRGEEPEGFEWEVNGVGKIIVTPHTTDLDFTVEGYTFKAHLTKEVLHPNP